MYKVQVMLLPSAFESLGFSRTQNDWEYVTLLPDCVFRIGGNLFQKRA